MQAADYTLARAAFIRACRLDVDTAKPGNVSVDSAGHGMTSAQFIASAQVSAKGLFVPGATVGARILDAVQRTQAAVGCNTNLGIVLLVAPLATALDLCEDGRPSVDAWRAATASILARLDIDDARAAFQAIALANPGGLGDAPEQSVHEPPTVNLRAAMTLAADRDSIARQYENGFRDVFETGLDAIGRLAATKPETQPATLVTLDVFLSFLAGWPDSHIVRKHGLAVAQSVTREARQRREQLHRALASHALPEALRELDAWDCELKARSINPGTSADLTVATLFVAEYSGLARFA
jgi:triphosphoribosyl-dephospho-CoA synthase